MAKTGTSPLKYFTTLNKDGSRTLTSVIRSGFSSGKNDANPRIQSSSTVGHSEFELYSKDINGIELPSDENGLERLDRQLLLEQHMREEHPFGPEEKFDFLKELVRDLYRYGLPAHHVDRYLEQLSSAFGLLQTHFRLEPNGFWVVRGHVTQYIDASKALNMNKLSRTTALAREIVK
eukprot:CFRG8636T1